LLQQVNNTPFQAGIALIPNEQGIDTLYISLKATFQIGRELSVAAEQRPLVEADEYWGEPGQSSLKYASEMHLLKPSTDVVMVGEAWAPNQRPASQVDVTLAVGGVKKSVRVFGDRIWSNGLAGLTMTSPVPFEKMPLIYERAFGGIHEADQEKAETLYESRNPSGCGFVGKRQRNEIDGMKLPNLEDPAHLIAKPGDQPPPAGFGCISPAWDPRKSYVGTYDEAWQKKRAPYLPEDFDSRFFNTAHPDLICKGYLKGGERVEVINASPERILKFKLPVCLVEAAVHSMGTIEKPPFHLETVLIEPGLPTLCMTYRASHVCGKKALRIDQVELALQRLDLKGEAA
jgi:hypothetical protein